MESRFPSPEAAAQAGDSHSRLIKVDYSPDGQRAVVFLEYNPASDRPELYDVLCEKGERGWEVTIGSNGGGFSWKITHEDDVHGELGVTTRWDPPRAEWDTRPPF